MIVLTKLSVADTSIRAAANRFAVQVETGGSGLARDGLNIKREAWPVNTDLSPMGWCEEMSERRMSVRRCAQRQNGKDSIGRQAELQGLL
jgi:hypothetical protein